MLSWATASTVTNSAGANVVPKSNGTNLVTSQINDDGTTVSIASGSGAITIIGAGNSAGLLANANYITTVGDWNSNGSGTTLTVNDAATRITAQGDLVTTTGLYPQTAGIMAIGTPALPFGSAYLGNAANNSTQLTGTFTANRVATFPDSTTKIPAAPQLITVSGMTTGRTWTAPDASFTLARTDAANTFTGNQSLVNKITNYNNINTAGWGVPAVYGSGRATAQTAANSSVATYTVGAADGSFIVSANLNVTTSTTHNFSVEVAYTDETNTARTVTFNVQQLGGTLVTAITNVTGAGPYEGVPLHIRAKASTAITIRTNSGGTYTTVTYSVEGSIIQIA